MKVAGLEERRLQNLATRRRIIAKATAAKAEKRAILQSLAKLSTKKLRAIHTAAAQAFTTSSAIRGTASNPSCLAAAGDGAPARGTRKPTAARAMP